MSEKQYVYLGQGRLESWDAAGVCGCGKRQTWGEHVQRGCGGCGSKWMANGTKARFRSRMMRMGGDGEPQRVEVSFGSSKGPLLERLMVVTCALLNSPEVAELVDNVTLSVEDQLVLVTSLVPEDMTPEQVQRRLLDAVPAEEPA